MVDYSLIAVWAALVLAAAFVLDRDNDPQWKMLVGAVVVGTALWRVARPGDALWCARGWRWGWGCTGR